MAGPDDTDAMEDAYEPVRPPGRATGRATGRAPGRATGRGGGVPDGALDEPPAGFDGDLDVWCAWRACNDLGNAERLVQRHGADMLHVHQIGWHVWDGRRWARDEGEVQVRLRAQDTAWAIRREARKASESADDRLAGRTGALVEHAMRSGASGAVSAMIKEAAPHLSRRVDDLDADPYLFNVLNGTLVLGPRVDLRPHDRADLITKLAPVSFAPTAAAPLFQAFLDRVFPTDEDARSDLQDFVQNWYGYAMTGDTGEQQLVFQSGGGANGKSVLTGLVSHVFGDYSAALPFASLLRNDRQRGGEPSPDIARLTGVRLVVASEPDLGSKLGESQIKELTGGEPVAVRHLHRDMFEMTPEFKLTLSGNHRPEVRGQDEGIWRRLNLVPFAVTIPKEERDKDLPRKLRAEGDGVLNWLVAGCERFCDGGLDVPDAVKDATRQYRDESSPLRAFMDDWVDPAPAGSVGATELYEAFRLWCRDNAIDPWKQTTFGLRLRDQGVHKDRVGGRVVYLNLDLCAEARVRLEDEAAKRQPLQPGDGEGGE